MSVTDKIAAAKTSADHEDIAKWYEDRAKEAEEKAATESEIRAAVREGMTPLEAYERYKTF